MHRLCERLGAAEGCARNKDDFIDTPFLWLPLQVDGHAAMEWVFQWDYHLFALINQAWSSAFLDWLLPWVRNKYVWIPLYAFLATLVVERYRQVSWLVLLLGLLAVATGDLVSSHWIKPWVERVRPCHLSEVLRVVVRVPCGHGFSFPSSHAVNHFVVAVFVGDVLRPFYRWLRPLLWLWAAAVAYAQVYVGVHFPLDVAAGMLLGIVIGRFFSFAAMHFLKTFQWRPSSY